MFYKALHHYYHTCQGFIFLPKGGFP